MGESRKCNRNSCNGKRIKTVTEYGEAAFYGPKLDFMVKDALGRKWQLEPFR
jgi:threonyl-tRNA synthetase